MLCVVSLLMSADTLCAQTSQNVIVYKKIGLFNPEDRTRQKFGKDIHKLIERELAAMFRFEIIPQQKLSKDLPLPTPDLIDLGKRFELDGIITGTVEVKDKSLHMVLTLLEAKTGDPFAKESVTVRDYKKTGVLEKAVRGLISKLIGRIPYQAEVIEVRDKGKTIRVGSGRLHGIGVGMKLQVFRVKKVNRHPFTKEVIGVDKVNVGELIVTRADERMSVAKPSRLEKSQVFAKGQYVVFKPSAKTLSETASRRDELLAQQEREQAKLEAEIVKETLAKEKKLKADRPAAHKVSRGNFELDAGLGWADFSLHSDQLVFDRKISTFPLAGASGEYWVVPSLGFDADYQIGFVKFDRVGGNAINVRARPYWYSFHLQYRHILWPGATDIELIGRLGYSWYTYRLSETDSQFPLNNTRYHGPSIGFETRLLLTSSLAAGIGADYLPVLKVDEHPVNSGEDASSHAIRFHVEGRYRLQPNFWISIRYLFKDFMVDFSGAGSQGGGITNARTTDRLSNVTLGFIAEF